MRFSVQIGAYYPNSKYPVRQTYDMDLPKWSETAAKDWMKKMNMHRQAVKIEILGHRP